MKINWNEEKTEKYFILFGKVMLVAIILLNAWMTHKYYFNFLRSDDSSELVYARLLAQKGSLITSDWYGSTELEILNTQLITSLLFHFTSNFQVVRITSQIILTCIFLGCYYYCLRGINPERAGARFWKSAFLLVIPISSAWIFLIMKVYYIPAVSVCLVAVGIASRMSRENVKNRQKILLLLGGCILAFVSGLEGVRHLELTYFPIVLAYVWIWWNEHEKSRWQTKFFELPKGLIASLIWTVSAFSGYLVNILVLSKKYTYYVDRKMAFQDVLSLESLQNVWNAFMVVTGYAGEKDLISVGGVCNVLAIAFGVVILYVLVRMAFWLKKQTPQDQFIPAFVIITFAFGPFLYFVINMVEARWIVCSTVPVALLLIFMDRIPWRKQCVLWLSLYAVILVLGGREYQAIRTSTQNEELRQVYDLIMDSDYTFGYATFRAGNLMTELTNGKIDMRIVEGYSTNHKLKNRPWLTQISFEYHDGAFPLILEKKRTEDLFDPQPGWELILDTDSFWVYEIQDQHAFQEYLDRMEL